MYEPCMNLEEDGKTVSFFKLTHDTNSLRIGLIFLGMTKEVLCSSNTIFCWDREMKFRG